MHIAQPTARRARMLWACSLDLQLVYCSGRLLDQLGLQYLDIANREWAHIIHPQELDRVTICCRRAYAARVPIQMHVRLRQPDGSYRRYLSTGAPLEIGGRIFYRGITEALP